MLFHRSWLSIVRRRIDCLGWDYGNGNQRPKRSPSPVTVSCVTTKLLQIKPSKLRFVFDLQKQSCSNHFVFQIYSCFSLLWKWFSSPYWCGELKIYSNVSGLPPLEKPIIDVRSKQFFGERYNNSDKRILDMTIINRHLDPFSVLFLLFW